MCMETVFEILIDFAVQCSLCNKEGTNKERFWKIKVDSDKKSYFEILGQKHYFDKLLIIRVNEMIYSEKIILKSKTKSQYLLMGNDSKRRMLYYSFAPRI